jgi:hypothetical protein
MCIDFSTHQARGIVVLAYRRDKSNITNTI